MTIEKGIPGWADNTGCGTPLKIPDEEMLNVFPVATLPEKKYICGPGAPTTRNW
jgi:hypothetical protein